MSGLVEYDFIRRNLPHAGAKTILPTNDYSNLEHHLDLLRDHLLARGLEEVLLCRLEHGSPPRKLRVVTGKEDELIAKLPVSQTSRLPLN